MQCAYLSNALCMHARGHAGGQPAMFDSRLTRRKKKKSTGQICVIRHVLYIFSTDLEIFDICT